MKPITDVMSGVIGCAIRSVLAEEGGCTAPIAAHATLLGDTVHLRALIGQTDGQRLVRGERSGPATDGERLGRSLADALLAEGGSELLAPGWK